MKAFVEQITVIVLLVVIFMIVCYVMGYNLSSLKMKVQKSISDSKLKKEESSGSTRYTKNPTVFYNAGNRTKIYERKVPVFILEEWHSHELISQYLVKNFPEQGLFIGCMPGENGITISGNDYVGRKHVILTKKTGDVYITDNDSKNGLFNSNKVRVKELKVDPYSGTSCYLADPDLNVQLRVYREYRAPQDVEGTGDYKLIIDSIFNSGDSRHTNGIYQVVQFYR